MGCWNKTCGLSGLPIRSGESVYVVVLEKNMDQTDRCYSTSFWQPAELLFEASYNDYGGGEDCTGIALPYIIHNLKISLVEKDVGENQSHDIAVKSDSFDVEAFFEAVHENRLFVSNYHDDAMVDFVMLRKDVVDHIIENRVINEYAGDGYIHYKFTDIVADIPALIDMLLEKKKQNQMFLSVADVFSLKDRYQNKTYRWVRSGGYRFSDIGEVSGAIVELLEQGNRSDAELLLKNQLMFRYIDSFMSSIRKTWAPGGHEGSQSQEYHEYSLLIDAMQKVIDNEESED